MGDDPESDLVRELRALAGATSDLGTFGLEIDGVRMLVEYTGGSSSRLRLSAKYDAVAHAPLTGGYRGGGSLSAIRPMAITLRPEQDAHRAAKAEGIDVEHQTGDRAFDHAVYVDTPTPSDVLSVVLAPDVRAAVLTLFALEFTFVEIDDREGRVLAEIIAFASLRERQGPGRAAAVAFAQLARSLPPVARAPGAHPPPVLHRAQIVWTVLAAIAFFGGAPAYFVGVARSVCDENAPTSTASCVGPGLVGGVAGCLVAVVVAVMVRRSLIVRHSGTSRSAEAIMGVAVAVFVVVAVVVSLAVSAVFIHSLS